MIKPCSMKNVFTLIIIVMTHAAIHAQDSGLPYYEIPDAPQEFTPGAVVARMIDGLGFRYYWATEGLTPEDLDFRPTEESRSTGETVDHIYGLAKVILNSALKQPNGAAPEETLGFAQKREQTLRMLHEAAGIFRSTDDLSQHTLIFKRGETQSEFPFWYQLNGPLADALWHCGQVVSHRRTSGNPFNSGASVFSGKVKQ